MAYTNSVQTPRWLNWDQYESLIPQYLKGTSFESHLKLFYDFMYGDNTNDPTYQRFGEVKCCDIILNALNIFDTDFNSAMVGTPLVRNKYKQILLDLLNMFGFPEKIRVGGTLFDFTDNPTVELVWLLRFLTIKNYFNGTREDLENTYKKYLNSNVFFQTTSGGNVNVGLVTWAGHITNSDTIKMFFSNGLLTPEILGVNHTYTVYILS